MNKVLLIQGANMEYLGIRQPELYGTTTAAELDELLIRQSPQNDIELEIRYTNIEGEAINWIYEADRGDTDGLLMNPAGFLFSGYALRDCLKAVRLPYIEIHMTNIDRRGYQSVIAPAADGMVMGLGIQSYVVALTAMQVVLDG